MEQSMFFAIFRVFGMFLILMILCNVSRNHSNKRKAKMFFRMLTLCLPLFLINLIWYAVYSKGTPIGSSIAQVLMIVFYVNFVLVEMHISLYSFNFVHLRIPVRRHFFHRIAEYILLLLPIGALLAAVLLEDTQTLSLSMLLLYMVSFYNDNQNELISLDPLTRLNNRNEFQGYLWYKLSIPLRGNVCLLMMDMNRFKAINDTYGHVEGDRALIRVAECLKKACGGAMGRPFIARYGGDEFVIIMETESDLDVEHLCDYINMMLAVENHRTKSPYELSISIGWVRNEQNNRSVRSLLRRADKELYEKKREWKEKECTA